MMGKTPAQGLFGGLSDGDASRREARNGLRHVGALSMTKLADGLLNPKLVLAWLAQAIGGALAALGPVAALTGFAVLSGIGGLLALGLHEVER